MRPHLGAWTRRLLPPSRKPRARSCGKAGLVLSAHSGSTNYSRLMLTEREAFDAMRSFLHAFWVRGGEKPDSELVDLLSWTGTGDSADASTNDPAQWHD